MYTAELHGQGILSGIYFILPSLAWTVVNILVAELPIEIVIHAVK